MSHVVHINNRAHELLQDYARRVGKPMGSILSRWILKELNANARTNAKVYAPPPGEITAWERPAFWERVS